MMEMISGTVSGKTVSPTAVSGADEAVKVEQSSDKAQDKSCSFKEVRDEYVPEEQQDPSGRYWMDRDKDGRLKIHFDDPEKSDPDSKPEVCRGSTDKVDREIEKLKKEQKELEQKISSETDEAKIRELENRLEQVESELRQKDNDTYRRRHTVFS